jgi:galactose mutarotase-like enzyme
MPAAGRSATGVGEHLLRHRHLGHLERDERPWLTTLSLILISFSRRLVSGVFGIAGVRMKLPSCRQAHGGEGGRRWRRRWGMTAASN